MEITVINPETASTAKQWAAGLWTYYKGYTHSAVHAAAAAALTIFGLLVFIDPLFAGVGIAAYVCPPVVLYVLGVDIGDDSEKTGSTARQTGSGSVAVTRSERESTHRTGDHRFDEVVRDRNDRDSDDGDTDSDGTDEDSDSDSDGGDSDSDGTDGDSDSDGTETDNDGVGF